MRGLDNSVDIATGWTAGVWFPERARDIPVFIVLHSVQTGSETHSAAYTMGTGGSFPGGKGAGA
jgi:hypothetical protein